VTELGPPVSGVTGGQDGRVIEVRPATPDDVASLVELIAERDRFYGVDRSDPDPAAIADALFGPAPAGRALVALRDGRVAGLAAYSFLWPAAGVTRSLYLKELFVRATARRHGVGRMLMRELHVVAAEHRCSRIEWTADTDQPDAQRFYASLGAEVLTTKLFYRV
jgi:GNAT superfamily N-acetyltransferase